MQSMLLLLMLILIVVVVVAAVGFVGEVLLFCVVALLRLAVVESAFVDRTPEFLFRRLAVACAMLQRCAL